MQPFVTLLAFVSLVAASEVKAPIVARQYTNSSAVVVDNPQTTFGAAAAAIQSAIAVGQALASAATESAPVLTTSTTSITETTPAATYDTSIIVAQPIASQVPTASDALSALAARPSVTTIPNPVVVVSTSLGSSATVGSSGTTTIDNEAYTTTVVAAYVTVAAQPTTIYENGIAYVASYAGETITVSNCPCTRSAKIAVMTTTICQSCDAPSSIVSATGSVATVNGLPVVFAAASSGSRTTTSVILSACLIVCSISLFMLS